jgi:hypothetical protein
LVQHSPTTVQHHRLFLTQTYALRCPDLPDNHADGCETIGIVQITPVVPATAHPALRARAMPRKPSLLVQSHCRYRDTTATPQTPCSSAGSKKSSKTRLWTPVQAFSSGVILRAHAVSLKFGSAVLLAWRVFLGDVASEEDHQRIPTKPTQPTFSSLHSRPILCLTPLLCRSPDTGRFFVGCGGLAGIECKLLLFLRSSLPVDFP